LQSSKSTDKSRSTKHWCLHGAGILSLLLLLQLLLLVSLYTVTATDWRKAEPSEGGATLFTRDSSDVPFIR